jgi:3D (Asp-Asp-Asp) domain-containing protein
MQEQKKETARRKSVIMRIVTLLVPVVVVLVLLSQTAFAQNTYVITDGERVVIHTSSATDPATILNEAGLSLGEDDTYTTSPGFGVSEIAVMRSAAAEEVTDDLRLSSTGVVHSTQTYTVSMPFETVYYNDETLPLGTEKVITAGREGQMQCTADVTYENGVETARTVTSKIILEQPVDQLVARGLFVEDETQQGKPIIGDGYIILPTGETLTYNDTMQVVATAYSHTESGCDFYTSTQARVRVGTVAVDPRVIPYGTRMFIVTNDGAYVYGISTAEDCGGWIKNKRVDLYYPTMREVNLFGVRDATIYFLNAE